MAARPELLAELSPFDLLDRECARVDAFFARCGDADWSRPTRCSDWSVRDMLGHLAFVEDYNQAGLTSTVAELIARSGATDADGINAWGVALRSDRHVDDVLAEWRALSADFRAQVRARGRDGSIDTSVGPYPSWQQSFYMAAEYAAHADDMAVPVGEDEAATRTQWRALFTRCALEEYEKPVTVEHAAGTNRITGHGETADLTDTDLVEAGLARLPADFPIAPALRASLACLA